MNKPSFPEIELNVKPESGQIMVEETATLSWKVREAQKVYVLQSPAAMPGVLAIDWQQLGQKDEEVESEGRMAVSPKTTTAYIVVALGKRGRKAQSVILEVLREKPRRGEATFWYQGWEPDWKLDPRLRFDEGVRRWRSCFGRDAAVTFSATPRANFIDEEATLAWKIACSDCAQMSSGGSHIILVEDLDRPSGTRVASESVWGADPFACSLNMEGSGNVGAWEGPGFYYWNIFAEGSWGAADSATVRVCFLPHPQFDSCNARRRDTIESALKNIYLRLLDGCIRDDDDLDDEVAAFNDGHLDRLAFWRRLLAEVENINLTTFRCVELDDEGWVAGRLDYTNEIEINWSHNPGSAVILHELIHKSGFHGALREHYGRNEIEEQVDLITWSCF